MKNRFLIFFMVYSVFFFDSLRAQQNVVDSLEHILNRAKTDSARVDALIAFHNKYYRDDPEKCWKALVDAKALSEKINYRKGIGLALDGMGNVYRRKKDFEKADQLFREAEIFFTEIHYSPGIGLCYLDLSINFSSWNKREESAQYSLLAEQRYRSGIKSSDKEIHDLSIKGLVSVFHFRFADFFLHGENAKGVEFLLKVVDEIGRLSPRTLPNIYNNLGAAYSRMGQLDNAIESYQKGLAAAEKYKDYDTQQYCLNNIASFYFNQSDYAAAYSYTQKALHIQLTYRSFDKRTIAISYQNLGEIAVIRGEYNTALENYLKALKIWEDLNELTIGTLQLSLSNLYLLQSDFKNALYAAEKALKSFQLYNNKIEIANTYEQFGNIASAQTRLDSALWYHLNALALRREVGNELYISISLFETGKVYSAMAVNYAMHRIAYNDSAIYFYNQSLTLSKKLNNKKTQVACYTGLGKVEESLNHLQQAATYYQLAAHIADSIGIKRELYEAYLYLAEVSEKLNRYDDAYRYHSLYSALKDSVFNETSSKQIKEMQAKYEAEKKDLQINSLNHEKEIHVLKVKEQQSVLLASNLLLQQRAVQITLLNQNLNIQKLKIDSANNELAKHNLETKNKNSELELVRKDQQLKAQDLERQKLLKNGFLLLAIFIAGLGFVLLNRFQLRKKLEKQQAILEERRRISSDMHDDLGSGLSKITLLSQVLKTSVGDARSKSELDKISESAQSRWKK